MQDWSLRALGGADIEAIAEHWRGLPGMLRYRCFGRLVAESELVGLAGGLDFRSGIFCGMFAPDGRLTALAWATRVAEFEDVPDYELHFSVLPDWQRNGFARALGERLCRMLAARGVRHLGLRFHRSNAPMRALALSLHFELAAHSDEFFGHCALTRPGRNGSEREPARDLN